jgi:hypothetical protein
MKIVKPGHHMYKHERIVINERSKANAYGDIYRPNNQNRSVTVCSVDQALKKTGMVSEQWRQQAFRVKNLRTM